MGILFKDVYTKSIALFDDPKITVAYETNIVQFEKIMYTYLQNAIGLFHNPAVIGMKLASYNSPVGKMETYGADGENREFDIDPQLISIYSNTNYSNGTIDYVFIENNKYVKGNVDIINNKVIFPDVLPEGQEYALEVYYCGEFLNNFDNLNSLTTVGDGLVSVRVRDILARLLVRSWAEEERNMVLDIRNLMTDTDFKLMSNDKILTSKNNWIDQLDNEIFQMQNRLAWTVRFTNTATNIGRG